MAAVCMRYSHFTINGKQLGLYGSRTESSCTVMAEWNTEILGNCSDVEQNLGTSITRAAKINYFCMHNFTLEGQMKAHALVNLSWFLYHSEHNKIGKPIKIWYDGLFEPSGIHIYPYSSTVN